MTRSRHTRDEERFDEPTSDVDDSLRWSGATVAYEAAEYAKDQVAQRLDAKMSRAARTLGSVAAVLRKNDAHVVEARLSDAAERAADELERIADYVKTKSLLDLVEDVESFARRQPAVFLGSAFVAGLLGGRFLKATTPSPAEGADAEAIAGAEERAPSPRRTPSRAKRRTATPRRTTQAAAQDDAPRERAEPKRSSKPKSNGASKPHLSGSAQARESHGRKN